MLGEAFMILLIFCLILSHRAHTSVLEYPEFQRCHWQPHSTTTQTTCKSLMHSRRLEIMSVKPNSRNCRTLNAGVRVGLCMGTETTSVIGMVRGRLPGCRCSNFAFICFTFPCAGYAPIIATHHTSERRPPIRQSFL